MEERVKINLILARELHTSTRRYLDQAIKQGPDLYRLGEDTPLKIADRNTTNVAARFNDEIHGLVKSVVEDCEYDLTLPGIEPAIKALNTGGGYLNTTSNLVRELNANEEALTTLIENVNRDFRFVKEVVLPASVKLATTVKEKLDTKIDEAIESNGHIFNVKVIAHFDEAESLVNQALNVRHSDINSVKTVNIYGREPIQDLWDKLASDSKYGGLFKQVVEYYKLGIDDLDLLLSTYGKTLGKGYLGYHEAYKLTDYWKGVLLTLAYRVYLDTNDITSTTIFWDMGKMLEAVIKSYHRGVESGKVIYKVVKSKNKGMEKIDIYILKDVMDKVDFPLDVIFGAILANELDISFEIDNDKKAELGAKYREYHDEIVNSVEKATRNYLIDIYTSEVFKAIEELKDQIVDRFGEVAENLVDYNFQDKLTVRSHLMKISDEIIHKYEFVSSELLGKLLGSFNTDFILEAIRNEMNSNTQSSLNNGIYRAMYAYILKTLLEDYTYEKK